MINKSTRRIFILFFTLILSACGGDDSITPEPTAEELLREKLVSGNYDCVEMQTSSGLIVLALDMMNAPDGVSNFLGYVNDGFYDNTIFHRVISGFMNQGGGFTTGLVEKVTRASIMNESDNGLSNVRGTISYARTSDPDSATSQFFINTVDNLFLNYSAGPPVSWGYAVFGEVVAGMDVVDAISSVDTGSASLTTATGQSFTAQDVPLTNVVIEGVSQVACSDVSL